MGRGGNDISEPHFRFATKFQVRNHGEMEIYSAISQYDFFKYKGLFLAFRKIYRHVRMPVISK
jgi:hypothetical protein